MQSGSERHFVDAAARAVNHDADVAGFTYVTVDGSRNTATTSTTINHGEGTRIER
jgi:hypothetical protein